MGNILKGLNEMLKEKGSILDTLTNSQVIKSSNLANIDILSNGLFFTSPNESSPKESDQVITGNEKLGDISPDKKSVFLTNEETGKGLKRMWAPIPSKDKIDQTVLNVLEGIKYARKKEFHISADNLENWLNGTAKPIYEFPENVKSSKYVKKGIERIFFFFIGNKNSKVNVSLIQFANYLKPEETRTWSDTWETIVELGNEYTDRNPLFFAFGSVGLKSYGQFTVNKLKDNTIEINGKITHTLYDKYNWNPGGSTLLTPDLRVYDNDLLYLEIFKNPKAKSYEFKSFWEETFLYKTYSGGSTLRMLGGRQY